jgi:hypothetical protein
MVMNNERWMKASAAFPPLLFADSTLDSSVPLAAPEAAGPKGAEAKQQGHQLARLRASSRETDTVCSEIWAKARR